MILTKRTTNPIFSQKSRNPNYLNFKKESHKKKSKKAQISFQGSDNVEFLKKVDFSNLLNFPEGSDFDNHKNDFPSVFE
jgi:hypothetical protein